MGQQASVGVAKGLVAAVRATPQEDLIDLASKMNRDQREKLVNAMTNQRITVDVLIIGGGFCGCWFADKIKREHPELEVLLVEATKRIGGRLYSDDNDEEIHHQDGSTEKVADELGGMRIFPQSMPKIVALVERFGLDLVPLKLGDDDNLFHYDGKVCKKKDAKYAPGGKWAGQHISAMSTAALTAYKASPAWEECGKEAYECPVLRNLSVGEFFTEYAGASRDEIRMWVAFAGYNLYHFDVQSSIYVDDGDLYGSAISEHHFVKQGYMQVVKRLLKESGVHAMMTQSVTSLRKQGEYNIATLNGRFEIAAKKVVVGMTFKQWDRIQGIDMLISAERADAVRQAKPISLFKCFMDYGHPWWQKHGFMHGKTTSVSDVRQIHYYDDEDLLIYVTDGQSIRRDHASRWGREFNINRDAALRRMHGLIKDIHMKAGVPEADIPEPRWDKCVHAFWESGSHKWKKFCDVKKCINLITDGKSDGSEVYIVGDAFCDQQGWVEGAIHSCEIAYEHAFGKGPPAPAPEARSESLAQWFMTEAALDEETAKDYAEQLEKAGIKSVNAMLARSTTQWGFKMGSFQQPKVQKAWSKTNR